MHGVVYCLCLKGRMDGWAGDIEFNVNSAQVGAFTKSSRAESGGPEIRSIPIMDRE